LIRLLKETEVHLILPLSRQVNDLHVAEMPNVFRNDSTEAEVAAFFTEKISEGARVFVAEQERTVQGYLLALPVQRAANPFQHATRYIELDQISIDAAHRGKGVGKALVQAMETWMRAQNYSHWKSSVYQFNEASNALMRGQGASATLTRYGKAIG